MSGPLSDVRMGLTILIHSFIHSQSPGVKCCAACRSRTELLKPVPFMLFHGWLGSLQVDYHSEVEMSESF